MSTSLLKLWAQYNTIKCKSPGHKILAFLLFYIATISITILNHVPKRVLAPQSDFWTKKRSKTVLG